MLLPKLKNNTWGTLAIESVLILLSVVLGFLITEWRQASENEALAQTAKQGVLNEIRENYRRVAEARRYHRTLEDTLLALDDPAPATVSRLVRGGFYDRAGIVSPAQTLSTAWETAQSTGAIRHMRWENVSALAEAYAAQRRYAQLQSAGTQAFMSLPLEGRGLQELFQPSGVRVVVGQYEDQERVLLSAYRKTLAHFDRSPPEDAVSLPARLRRPSR